VSMLRALLASTVLVFVLGLDRYQYVHHVKGCVDGYNIGQTTWECCVNECAALCDAYGNMCQGFEFGVAYGGGGEYEPGDCKLKMVAVSGDGCDGAYHNLDFYSKDFNAPMTTTWTVTASDNAADNDYGDDGSEGIDQFPWIQDYVLPFIFFVGVVSFLRRRRRQQQLLSQQQSASTVVPAPQGMAQPQVLQAQVLQAQVFQPQVGQGMAQPQVLQAQVVQAQVVQGMAQPQVLQAQVLQAQVVQGMTQPQVLQAQVIPAGAATGQVITAYALPEDFEQQRARQLALTMTALR